MKKAGRRRGWALALLAALLALGPVPGAAGEVVTPGESRFCMFCTRIFEVFPAGEETAGREYVPLDGLEIRAGDTQIVFSQAEEALAVYVDREGLEALVEAVRAAIAPEYRRVGLQTVRVVVSGEDYVLRRELWSGKQRYRLDRDALGDYFTSDAALGDAGGCCLSFPESMERERVIWLAAGEAVGGDETMEGKMNCAYSFHALAAEGTHLNMKLIHELVHALGLTRMLPSLETYGFVHNEIWELRRRASGMALPALETAEAYAYDLSRQVTRELRPGTLFVFGEAPETEAAEETGEVLWVEMDGERGQAAGVTWIPSPPVLKTRAPSMATPSPGEIGPIDMDAYLEAVPRPYEQEWMVVWGWEEYQ